MKIGIIGSGNVAYVLTAAFSKIKSIELFNYARNGLDLKKLVKKYKTTCVATMEDFPKDVSLILLCVSDDAIQSVSKLIPSKLKCIVAHTSGSVPIDLISSVGKPRRASFYPLQTMRKGKTTNFSKVPICITSHDKATMTVLKHVAGLISHNVHEIKDTDKIKVHIAAVMMNNFVNHLAVQANDFLDKNKLPYEILFPLIKETYEKTGTIPLDLTQTGPASRNDSNVIKNHLLLLKDYPNLQQIYKVMSKSIVEYPHKKISK